MAAKPVVGRGPELQERVEDALSSLKQMSTPNDLDNLTRFGIAAKQALGVSMANIQKLAKRLGQDHELAAALWDTGCYEARLLCAFVADPQQVSTTQMERWCQDFDNWGICDTLCFKLFDRTPHAWARVSAWSTRRAEFEKRAAFALLASLAGHDKESADAPFLEGLRLVERAAGDDRNFVKKGVSWALRGIGHRNPALHAAAVALSRRLADSADPTQRWLGKDALRDLTRPAVVRRMASR